ncbi:MAG: Flp pilus assembly protein CpaB [Firmicutes bacterium]|nr:Flp pilus assembly protein CpaB [Bacillota bacterium]
MAKLSSKGLMGIATVLSLVVAGLVYNYLNDVQQTAKVEGGVVVAKADIAPNTRITAEMVELVKVDSNSLQAGAKTDIASVVGVYAKQPIGAQAQITDQMISGDPRNAGFAGIIPQDKRAISIPVDDVTGVAGLLKPGDYVDIIVTVDQESGPLATMSMQNVLVLATNKNVEQASGQGEDKGAAVKNAEKLSTVTVALTPNDATSLALAQVKGSSVRLALRPFTPLGDGSVQVGVKDMSSLVAGVYTLTSAPQTPKHSEPAPKEEYKPEYIPPVKVEQPVQVQTPKVRTVAVIKGTASQDVPIE